MTTDKPCVFCSYVSDKTENSESIILKKAWVFEKLIPIQNFLMLQQEDLFYNAITKSQTDDLVVFRDIRPAAKHHLLACPARHIPDAKQLTKADAKLLEDLVLAGIEAIEKLGGRQDDTRIGIHWPPFCMVKHFHVHFIWPESDMNWLSRIIFRRNSYWFCSVPSVLDYLKNLPE